MLSLVAICAYILEAVRHPEMASRVFAMIGIAMFWCAPFGAAGLLLRRRRLKRQAARQAFLKSLSAID